MWGVLGSMALCLLGVTGTARFDDEPWGVAGVSVMGGFVDDVEVLDPEGWEESKELGELDWDFREGCFVFGFWGNKKQRDVLR